MIPRCDCVKGIDKVQTTGDAQSKWGARVTGLLKENLVFFQNGTIMYAV